MFEFDDLEELEAQQEDSPKQVGEEETASGSTALAVHGAASAATSTGLGGAVAAAQRAAKDLHSEDAGLRWEACRELAKLCAAAQTYVSALEALAQDPDDDVRRAGKKALRELRAGAESQPSAQVVSDVLSAQEKRTVSAVLAAAAAAPTQSAQPLKGAADYEIKEYQVKKPDKSARAKRGDGPAFLRLLERHDQKGDTGEANGDGDSHQNSFQGGGVPEAGGSIFGDGYRDPYGDPPRDLGRGPGVGLLPAAAGHDSDAEEQRAAKQPSAKPAPPSKSWLDGRSRKATASLLPPVPSEDDLPVDPLRLNFKIYKSKKHIEIWPMLVEREGMTPAEICEIWEQSWGVMYASRVRMEPPLSAGTKWLHPQEAIVPSSPAVVRLDASGSILYTLSAALKQYGPLGSEDGLAAKEQRQTDATLSAGKRADADAREAKRYAGLEVRQRYDNRQRR